MLVSWSWEWASCTIFSRAVVDAEIEAMLEAEYNLYVDNFTEKTTGEN